MTLLKGFIVCRYFTLAWKQTESQWNQDPVGLILFGKVNEDKDMSFESWNLNLDQLES